MENLPNINEVLDNKYFQVGMIVWVVFFSGCITSMVPDNVRRLLDNSAVRVAVLALVVYLADKDFKLAVVVAAGFFLSTAPLDVKEGMAVPDDCEPIIGDNLFTNPLQVVTSCGDAQCEVVQDSLISAPKCEPKCASADSNQDCNTIGDKCDWDGSVCQKSCTTFDKSSCPTGRCASYEIDGDDKCEKPCNKFTKNNCPTSGNNSHCKLDNDTCIDK